MVTLKAHWCTGWCVSVCMSVCVCVLGFQITANCWEGQECPGEVSDSATQRWKRRRAVVG